MSCRIRDRIATPPSSCAKCVCKHWHRIDKMLHIFVLDRCYVALRRLQQAAAEIDEQDCARCSMPDVKACDASVKCAALMGLEWRAHAETSKTTG